MSKRAEDAAVRSMTDTEDDDLMIKSRESKLLL